MGTVMADVLLLHIMVEAFTQSYIYSQVKIICVAKVMSLNSIHNSHLVVSHHKVRLGAVCI